MSRFVAGGGKTRYLAIFALVFTLSFAPISAYAATGFWGGLWCGITGIFGFECIEETAQVVETKVSTTIPPAPEEANQWTASTTPEGRVVYTTVVENNYITNNPTTIVREYHSSGGGGGDSDGISRDLFRRQIEVVFENIGENIDSIQDGIAEAITTAVLTVSGNGSIGGNLDVIGTLTAGTLSVSNLSSNSTVEAPRFSATSTTATSTFSGGLSAASSLYVQQNGKVGIGTTSIPNTLSVDGYSSVSRGLSIGSSSATYPFLVDFSTTTQSDQTSPVGFIRSRITSSAGSAGASYRGLYTESYLSGSQNVATYAGNYVFYSDLSTGGTVDHFLGLVGRVKNAGTNNTHTLSAGVYSDFQQTGDSTTTSGAAYWANLPTITAGTTTNAYGMNILAITSQGGFIENAHGIKVAAPNLSANPAGGLTTNAYGFETSIPTGATGNNIGILVGSQPSGPVNSSLYVSSGTSYFGGSVGIGTSSPYQNLTIQNGSSLPVIALTNGNSSADIRFGRGSSSFGTAATTDLGIRAPTGSNFLLGVGGNEYMRIGSTGLVGIGTTTPSEKLSILSEGNSASTNIFAVRANNLGRGIGLGFNNIRLIGTTINQSLSIDAAGSGDLLLQTTATGKVSVGSTTPSGKLSLTQSANTAAGGFWIAENGNTDYRSMFMNTSGVLSFNGGDTAGTLNTATLNAAGEWTNASDIAYKENVENLPYGLDAVLALQPRSYDIKNTNNHRIGFIAQEVEGVIPEVVGGAEGSKGISYGNLVAVVVKAIQELSEKISGFADSLTTAVLNATNVNTEKLCIGQTCITEGELIEILDEANQAPTPSAPTPEEPEPPVDETPDEIIEEPEQPEEPQPEEEPTPELEPESAPEPVSG